MDTEIVNGMSGTNSMFFYPDATVLFIFFVLKGNYIRVRPGWENQPCVVPSEGAVTLPSFFFSSITSNRSSTCF
jgi:hypothetical protein